MDKRQILESLKSKDNISLRELIAELAAALPFFAGKQQKYGVSTYPDERTLRYYMNEGLIDRPGRYRGASGVFSYRHILQVLTVKYLQAEYFPLNKIKDMLSGLGEDEMKNILLEGGKPYGVMRSRRASNHAPGRISERRSRALRTGEIAPMADDLNFVCESLPVYTKKTPEEWLRIPVTEGVELNVKAEFLPANQKQKKEFIENLSARLRMFVENEKNRGGYKNGKDG